MDMPFLRSLQKKIDPSLPHSVGKKTLQTQLSEEEHKKLREQLEKVHEYNQKRGLTDRITERHMAQDSYLLSKIVSSKAYQSSDFSDYLFNTLKKSFLHDYEPMFLEKIKVLQEKMMHCMSVDQSPKYLQAEYQEILSCIAAFKDDLKQYSMDDPFLKKQIQKAEEAIDKEIEKVKIVLKDMGLKYLPEPRWKQKISGLTSRYFVKKPSKKVNLSSIKDTKKEVASTIQDTKKEVASTENRKEANRLESAKEKKTIPSMIYHPAKLKNYGGGSFINSFINNMLVFLDEEDIALMEKENNSGNIERYFDKNIEKVDDKRKEIHSIEKDLILRLQKGLINMWRARHKNPPEDITKYHRDFIFDLQSLATYIKSYNHMWLFMFCDQSRLKDGYESYEQDKQDPDVKVPEFTSGSLRKLSFTMQRLLFSDDMQKSSRVYDSEDDVLSFSPQLKQRYKLSHNIVKKRSDAMRNFLILPEDKEDWTDQYLRIKPTAKREFTSTDQERLQSLGLDGLEENESYTVAHTSYKSVSSETKKIIGIGCDLDEKEERDDFVDIIAEHAKNGLYLPEVKDDDQDYKGVAVFKPCAIACEYDNKFFTVLLDDHGKVVTQQENESVKENLNVNVKKHLSYFLGSKTSLPYQIIYKRVE